MNASKVSGRTNLIAFVVFGYQMEVPVVAKTIGFGNTAATMKESGLMGRWNLFVS